MNNRPQNSWDQLDLFSEQHVGGRDARRDGPVWGAGGSETRNGMSLLSKVFLGIAAVELGICLVLVVFRLLG